MGKMALKSIATGACFAFAVGGIVACSSSSSPSTSTGGDGGGGTGTGSNICPKLPVADIQALQTAAPGTLTESDFAARYECDTADLQLQLDTDDADKTTYYLTMNAGDADGGAPENIHQMSGVGDEAYWFSVPGTSAAIGNGIIAPPIVNVHKGSASCYLNPTSEDFSHYTMPATQGLVSVSDGDAWAAKAGKLCLDYFAAAGD